MSKRTAPNNVAPSSVNADSTGASTQYGAKNKAVIVKSNSHAVQQDADGALWDVTSNAYVKPEDTNIKDPA